MWAWILINIKKWVKQVSGLGVIYISFIIKYEYNWLVECDVYLLFMLKVKCDSYYGTDQNCKMWHLLWGGGSKI